MRACYEKKSFSEHFRRINPKLLISDESSRIAKAWKIYAIIKDYVNDPERLKKSRCLDLGSSEGHISRFMADFFGEVIGIDTDQSALRIASNKKTDRPARFVCGSGLELPFRERSFDIVICNQIYEHVPDPVKLVNEIKRVLKGNGICLFGAGNRLKIMEGHYGLPFLSWLPQGLANWYLRAVKKGEVYDERHLTYWGIRKLIKDFVVKDYTIAIIKDPQKFQYLDAPRIVKYASKCPGWLLRLLFPFISNYIFILSLKSGDHKSITRRSWNLG